MKRLLITSRVPAIANALAHSVRTYTSSLGKPYRVQAIPFSSAEELFVSVDELTPAELRDAVIALDLDSELSDPWSVGQTGSFGLAARLVLQYPEVFFAWYGPKDGWLANVSKGNVVARGFEDLLRQIERHEGGARELFDGSGFRSRLKVRVYDEALASLDLSPPARECVISRSKRLALAADEEPSFLSLNGYAAYRFGWRAALAPTTVELLRLVGESANQAPGNGSVTASENAQPPQSEQGYVEGRIDLAILDWDLRYPDDHPWKGKSADGSLSGEKALLNRPLMLRGCDRVSILDCLREANTQILLVSGAQMEKLPPEGNRLKHVAKPYGGIFSLPVEERKVSSRPKSKKSKSAPKGVREAAFGGEGQVVTKNGHSGHSAPYGCLTIADHLLSRSRSLAASNPTDVESWVQVALLALEAKELLGGLSKTASFEALALQQEAEVAAEASFIGVSPDLSVGDRLADLEVEAGELAKQIEGRHRTTTTVNSARKALDTAKFSALAQIVNKLRLRLIAHEKVRNSEECLRQFASYQRRLEWLELTHASPNMKGTWRPLSKGRTAATRFRDFLSWSKSSVLNWFLACWKYVAAFSRFVGRSYVDLVTGAGTKPLRLLLSSVGWIFLFTGLYLILMVSLPHRTGSAVSGTECATLAERPSCWEVFSHSALTFVQLQAGTPEVDEVLKKNPGYRIILFLQLCLAYLHLGLLISVLHRQLTRRAP
ncbi:MAG TPA: hypothetical protein VF173_09215 [Thermoanaerobaculia bacterium]|nr:hypothetical protein [Thermoanaerobaculia bacterium]